MTEEKDMKEEGWYYWKLGMLEANTNIPAEELKRWKDRHQHLKDEADSGVCTSPEEWFKLLGEAEDRKLGFMKGLHKRNRKFKNEKFYNVPDDAGTLIILETEAEFGEYDVLFQHWVWDHIDGESLIFVASDVAHLSDDELLGQVRDSAINTVKSGLTIKRNTHGYTFVNLNFKAIEDEDDETEREPLTPEEQKQKSIGFRQYIKSRNEQEIENLKSTMLHKRA